MAAPALGTRAAGARNATAPGRVGSSVTAPTQARITRASVGLRSERGPVLLAVMLSTGLVAIDATILAVAVPAVGLAWSMGSLVAFRLLQGLGAGAVQPIGMTIIGDIYSVAERATVQGYLAAVWAISSLVGPTLGGIFADYLSWRWIFFVNLPLGAVATWMLWRRLEE